jgi:hypothetical protein
MVLLVVIYFQRNEVCCENISYAMKCGGKIITSNLVPLNLDSLPPAIQFCCNKQHFVSWNI